MAKKARKKIILPLDTEENKDHSISANLAAQAQKQKLLDQIAMLRTYVSVLENKLETPKFGQLKLLKSFHDKVATRRGELNMQTELRRDLYRFMGMQCVKCEGSFVFEMPNTNDVRNSELYAIQILIDNHGRGKLGKWILPTSVDVEKILLRHPIDDLNNVKQFLKSCKHHVDCYICRAEQLEKLRNILYAIKNARVFHTIGIAQIELIMLGVKDVKNDTVHNVTLYLSYNSAEVRPYKLLPDTNDNERPSANLFQRLNKHFKTFLKNDLSSAFQQVHESQTEFLWKPIAAKENENNLNISGESFEDAGFLSAYLHRDKKEAKQKKSKNKDERSARENNDTEMSLRVQGEQRKNADVKEDKTRDYFLGDDKKVKPRKHKRPTTMKLPDAKKSWDDLKESEGEVVNVEKRNITSEKSKKTERFEMKVMSVTNSIQRKQPKKRQTDTENAQIGNNNALSKDENNHGNNKIPRKKADGKAKTARHQTLFAKSKNTNSKIAKSSQRTQKRKRAITLIDKENQEDCTISNLDEENRNARVNVSSSTPFTKKLPDKRKFFHASHISEILQ